MVQQRPLLCYSTFCIVSCFSSQIKLNILVSGKLHPYSNVNLNMNWVLYSLLSVDPLNIYFKVIIVSIRFKELFGLEIKYILHN